MAPVVFGVAPSVGTDAVVAVATVDTSTRATVLPRGGTLAVVLVVIVSIDVVVFRGAVRVMDPVVPSAGLCLFYILPSRDKGHEIKKRKD